jgi:phage gp36-like protein
MEDLKKLFGDELYASVSAKIGDKQLLLFEKDEKIVVDDGKLIPKYRLDEVRSASESLKAQVEQYEKDMKVLKKAAEGNTDLVGQIEQLQSAAKTAKAEAEQAEARVRKQFALKEALLNAGVVNADARDLLSHRFDLEKLEIDAAGKIKGFDDALKPVKENKAFAGMFGEVKFAGQEHAEGDLPAADLGEYGKKNPFAKATLNISEQVKLTKTRPELAAKLKALAQA